MARLIQSVLIPRCSITSLACWVYMYFMGGWFPPDGGKGFFVERGSPWGREELASGGGRREVGGGRWAVGGGRWAVGGGRWAEGGGRCEYWDKC